MRLAPLYRRLAKQNPTPHDWGLLFEALVWPASFSKEMKEAARREYREYQRAAKAALRTAAKLKKQLSELEMFGARAVTYADCYPTVDIKLEITEEPPDRLLVPWMSSAKVTWRDQVRDLKARWEELSQHNEMYYMSRRFVLREADYILWVKVMLGACVERRSVCDALSKLT